MTALNYVIQARITAMEDGQTCKTCGGKALFSYVSYEVTDKAAMDAFMQNMHAHAQESLESLFAYVKSETVEQDTIWYATLAEQEKGLPQEHLHETNCGACLSGMIDMIMGMEQVGAIGLLKCQQDPAKNALFLARATSDPTCPMLVSVDFQDVARAVQYLHTNE